MKLLFIYILASKPYGTLYTGVTSDLVQRIHQHKSGEFGGFTSRYGVDRLVYFETCEDSYQAILREKQIKKWKRAWKIELIERFNPDWRDLTYEITG